jgi:uncharacterized protein YcnI
MPMKQKKLISLAVACVLGVSFFTAGCAHTVSKTEETRVSSTGAVTTKEKTITQNPDGTLNQTETRKIVRP